ncbi:RNA ligase/cyclic nucleotide phosphodiesterase [Cladochytrium replicatum]|nr:RNA ligase/cyclic nucleotide phosphodiesterase [Cladochytrium replicatum]
MDDLYDKPVFKGYSLWLCSADAALQAYLRSVVDALADEYNSPKWDPHITLIGSVALDPEELLERLSTLSSSRSLSVTLPNVAIKDLYFQCVMAKVEETWELMELNRKARDLFGKTGDPSFWPHMSLVYGHFGEDEKRAMAKRIEENWDVVGRTVRIDRIQVWNTNGKPESWTKVGEVLLQP